VTNLVSPDPFLMRPGDRLSLEEFLERWRQMPELKSAELIDGVVYMPSPVSLQHMRQDGRFFGLCASYCFHTPGVECGINGTWLMTSTSAPQPDCSVWVVPQYGGRLKVKDTLASGVPELAAETCYSSRAYDLGPKLALYQSAGVNEYVAVLVEERRIEWRILVDGSYQLLPDDAGIYRSKILPGLWVDSNAFWNEDSTALLRTLEQGLASAEHAEFVQKLNAAAANNQTL